MPGRRREGHAWAALDRVRPLLRRSVSAWYVACVAVCVAGVVLTADVVRDPDVYWHRIVGAHLLNGDWGLTPDPISYVAGRSWFSVSWVMDVGYAELVDHLGYAGVVSLRFVLAAVFYTGLTVLCARSGAPPAAAFVVTLAIGLPAFTVIQDRPQTVSLVLLLVLSAALDRAFRHDIVPPWWAVGAFSWLWANVHGLWVLVPASLLLLAVRALLLPDRAAGRPLAGRLTGLAAVALVAGACTPVGPRLLLSPWRISSSAGALMEWHATTLTAFVAWGLTSVIVLVVLGWARARETPSWGDLLYCGAWMAFGALAFRNATPAALVLAPLATRSLAAVAPALARTTLRVPVWVLPAVAALGLIVAIVRYVQVPVTVPGQPIAIARTLAARPPSHVMATYNSSGFIREFGGDNVRVALDGRADRYGGATIGTYLDAFRGVGDWRAVLRHYDPDYVVAERRTPLPDLLTGIGWRRIQRDGDFVLLQAPRR